MAGSSKGPSKTALVTDLDKAYKALNLTLEKTKTLSEGIKASLSGTLPGGAANGGGASSMSGSATNIPYLTPQQVMSGGSNNSSSNASGWKSAVATMAGGALTALANGVNGEDYILNSTAINRFGFYSGSTNQSNASGAFKNMNQLGTATSALDAANAAMSGNSSGLMSGLKNYSSIAQSAAGVSNLMPGVGIEGGMGAVASLNQGASVNKLRMIGINVRDQNGYMRDIEAIARDLWKNLTTTKSGKGSITAEQLSFSLQSGNSLDMMLNQYFGNDAVLRQSVISYLYQFAAEGGKAPTGGYTSDAGKKALLASGANPSITQSIGNRNAAGYNITNSFTSAGVSGIEWGNKLVSDISNTVSDVNSYLNGFAGTVVGVTTFLQTLSGAGNGAGGILIGSALSSLKSSKGVAGLAMSGAKVALTAGATAVGAASLAKNLPQILSGTAPDVTTTDPGTGSSGSSGSSGSTGTAPMAYVPGGSVKLKIDNLSKKATASEMSWALKLLRKLGDPITVDNVAALVAWHRREGGGGKNNPLNTTEVPDSGSYSNFNSVGVKNYSSEAQGIAATVKTLKNGAPGYSQILKDLKSGTASENAILQDVADSAWNGASHYGGTMVHINLPNVTKITDPELKKVVQGLTTQSAQTTAIRGGVTGA